MVRSTDVAAAVAQPVGPAEDAAQPLAATPTPAAADEAGQPATLASVTADMERIFTAIRREARYEGRLVALTYYPQAYNDPADVGLTRALNASVVAATRRFHVAVADGFGAFRGPAEAAGGSACAAGLLIQLAPGQCDIHPTPLGRDLLASAVIAAARGDAGER